MKTDVRRFAPLGIALAILGAIAFVGTLLTKGLAVAGVFTLPDLKILDQIIWVCLGLVVLGLALAALFDPDRARKFFLGRQLQYGSNAVIMLVAFLGIIFFINLIVYQYSPTMLTPWDFTEGQENTLAAETINLLKALPKTITVRAYYVNPDDTIQKLLDKFKQNSDGKLTYEFINPNYDPVQAQKDGITRDATIVMQSDDRTEKVTFATEQDLDTTILKLINPNKRTVYFLTGHAEHDMQTTVDTSISQIKSTLENKNYTVELLNLNNKSAVPDDANTVVVAGPQAPLSVDEVNVLEAYLDKGGAVIVMEDPRQLTKFGDAPDPLADLTAKWGITLENDLVIDSNAANPLFAIADTQSYSQHPITFKLIGYNLAFYTARSLKLSEPQPDGINNLTPLVQTYATNVWGETDTQGDTVSFDPGKDIAAPLTLAAAAEKTATKGRLVVFGDSDFITNAYQENFGDIFINAIDWSTQQENLISLTPKNSVSRSFSIPDTTALVGSILLSVCLIPLLIVLGGVGAWFSRRRRG